MSKFENALTEAEQMLFSVVASDLTEAERSILRSLIVAAYLNGQSAAIDKLIDKTVNIQS